MDLSAAQTMGQPERSQLGATRGWNCCRDPLIERLLVRSDKQDSSSLGVVKSNERVKINFSCQRYGIKNTRSNQVATFRPWDVFSPEEINSRGKVLSEFYWAVCNRIASDSRCGGLISQDIRHVRQKLPSTLSTRC
ncbi:hypothetical protein KQX54_008402 [Cotesia glomerata]|uniref:Uncharacterized protein n=1 Tax=Cotesia glomerata TaxID=32391 RepID=A0AAV7J1F5_COTGL|nr:hypothetical protein KQX54_008402 [Cotesia glomerata]